MDNEMGNSNTSGLREEESGSNEVLEKSSLQETVHSNGIKQEIGVAPTDDSKDHHEKTSGLPSDDTKVAADASALDQTSDDREEKNGSNEVQEKALQENVHSNGVQEEIHVAPVDGSNDYYEKTSGLASENREGAADASALDHTSNARELEEKEIQLPEPPKSPTKSNEVDCKNSEFQSASLSEELDDLEKATGPNVEEGVLEATADQLERQSSLRKESQDLVDSQTEQIGFAKCHPDRSVQDGTDLQRSIEDSPDYTVKIGGLQSDTSTDEDLDGNVISGTHLDSGKKGDDLLHEEIIFQEDKKSIEEKFQIERNESKNGSRGGTTISTDLAADAVDKCDGSLAIDKNCNGNGSLEFNPEVNLPEDKFMVPSEKPIGKESGGEESQADYSSTWLGENPTKEPEMNEPNASQIESLIELDCTLETAHSLSTNDDPANNGKCQVNEVKGAAEHSHDNVSLSDNQNEDSQEHDEPTGEAMISPELGMLQTEFSIPKGEFNEEGRSCKFKEQKQTENYDNSVELNEEKDGSCVDQRYQNEEEPAEKYTEGIEVKNEASTLDGEDIEKGGNEWLMTSSLLEQALVHPPVSLFQPRNQPNIAMGYEDTERNSERTPELKPENLIEVTVRMPSTFHARSLTIGNFVSPIDDLAIEKPPQKTSNYITATQNKVTEINSSTSGYKPGGQCELVEAPGSAKNGYEARGSVGSVDSNPDSLNIPSYMRKSPSFDFDLRIEVRSEESDQTPLLYQDKNTIKRPSNLSPATDRQNNQNLLLPVQLEHQALPVEEKVITLTRSDSEKSRTPFLGFSKEDEDGISAANKRNNHSSPKKTTKDFCHPPKEVAATPHKGKDKHKRRASLFGTCMCCATVK